MGILTQPARKFKMHVPMGTRKGAVANPFADYKSREGLDYARLASRLGISVSYAKKLGSGNCGGISPTLARSIHRRTRGGLDFQAIMDWAARPRKASPAPRRRSRAS